MKTKEKIIAHIITLLTSIIMGVVGCVLYFIYPEFPIGGIMIMISFCSFVMVVASFLFIIQDS